MGQIEKAGVDPKGKYLSSPSLHEELQADQMDRTHLFLCPARIRPDQQDPIAGRTGKAG